MGNCLVKGASAAIVSNLKEVESLCTQADNYLRQGNIDLALNKLNVCYVLLTAGPRTSSEIVFLAYIYLRRAGIYTQLNDHTQAKDNIKHAFLLATIENQNSKSELSTGLANLNTSYVALTSTSRLPQTTRKLVFICLQLASMHSKYKNRAYVKKNIVNAFSLANFGIFAVQYSGKQPSLNSSISELTESVNPPQLSSTTSRLVVIGNKPAILPLPNINLPGAIELQRQNSSDTSISEQVTTPINQPKPKRPMHIVNLEPIARNMHPSPSPLDLALAEKGSADNLPPVASRIPSSQI